MSSDLGAFDYVVFSISLAACAIVGAYYVVVNNIQSTKGPTHSLTTLLSKTICFKKVRKEAELRRNQSTASFIANDYFMGGRHMPFIPTLFSIFASYFSAITLLGTPAEIYTIGTVHIFSAIAFIPASIFIAFTFVPIYYKNKFNSVYQYIELRFESPLLRKITTTLSLASALLYAGVCAYIPCIAFQKATGVPDWVLVIGTGVLTVFYTAVGGLKAVVWVDTIQAAIMFFGVIAVLIAGSIKVGGIGRAWEIADAGGRIQLYDFRLDPTISRSFWSQLIGPLVYWIGGLKNQAVLQRTCSFDSLPKAILSLVCVGPLVLLLTIVLWLATIVAYAYFTDVVGCDPFASGEIFSENQIMSHFVSVVMNYPGFLGLYFASIFSGALSSMSTCYNSVSSMLWEDWMKKYLESKLTKRQISLTLKLLSVVLGVVTVLLSISCKYVGGTAIKMTVSLLSGTGGAVMACFMAAGFMPFVTSMSLAVSVLITTPFVMWIILSQIYYKLSYYPWLPFEDRNCPMTNSTFSLEAYHSGNLTSEAAELPEGLRNLFSLSFYYFTLFTVVTTLVIASILSLISRLLAKKFVDNKWLRTPEAVNPHYLALSWPFSNLVSDASDDSSGSTDSLKKSDTGSALDMKKLSVSSGEAKPQHINDDSLALKKEFKHPSYPT